MNECWCAFALSIMSTDYLTPEKAFERMDKGKMKKHAQQDARHAELTELDIVDMITMKETMTYKQVGMVYGMKADAVYNRIRRYKGVI